MYSKQFSISTSSKIELVNITPQVLKVVDEGAIEHGVAIIFSPHTTTAILINENEPRLVKDIEGAVKKLIPWNGTYGHNTIDHNAPAHIVGAFLGNSTTLIVEKGKLGLGTWQSIFLLELDGPRLRQVKVKVIG